MQQPASSLRLTECRPNLPLVWVAPVLLTYVAPTVFSIGVSTTGKKKKKKKGTCMCYMLAIYVIICRDRLQSSDVVLVEWEINCVAGPTVN